MDGFKIAGKINLFHGSHCHPGQNGGHYSPYSGSKPSINVKREASFNPLPGVMRSSPIP